MLNNNINSELLRCRIYRLLFLLFLSVFAVSPIADAYTNSLCSSTCNFNDSNDIISIDDLNLDDDYNSCHVLIHEAALDHALLQQAPSIDGPAGHITTKQLPLNDRCSSQHTSLASSDPSPPVI
jgi:hypothetical protein